MATETLSPIRQDDPKAVGNLRAGAERFRDLMKALRDETERGTDLSDLNLKALGTLIEDCLPNQDTAEREGFMRGLADVLCCFMDGATFDIDSLQVFENWSRGTEAGHG